MRLWNGLKHIFNDIWPILYDTFLIEKMTKDTFFKENFLMGFSECACTHFHEPLGNGYAPVY